ncbi:MAG: glutamate-cysteine ligase family protein [Streptosporangiaceae bacterium]
MAVLNASDRDASARNARNRDGSSHDGSARIGSARIGSAQDGPAQDRPAQDGPARGSAARGGSAQATAAQDSSARDAAASTEPLTVAAAYAWSQRAALAESQVGAVGLEIETHLVDLDSVADRVPWDRAAPLPEIVGAVAGPTAVTLEPGGQLELSGPPSPDVVTAVTQLRHDLVSARLTLAGLRLGLAHAGADPLRPPCRINPRPRYRAMAEHYAATGRARAAAVMMTSTAALQVNLQAGPPCEWAQRVARAYRLGPTLLAISASSPWLCGRDTGWKSARQRAWSRLGARSCGPVPGCVAAAPDADGSLDPAAAWARFALRAPVAFIRSGRGEEVTAVRARVPFEHWASGRVRLGGRAPTTADLDVHLTTLFPPVRLRGYLELRYLDVAAPRWWPAVAAVAATLMDDPVAADLATEATEQAAALWASAARDGLADPRLAASARRCLDIAAGRAPARLARAVADLAELVESGRCPGDLLAERIGEIGPHAAFEELAHA